jgi:hypothetical protein
MTDISSLAGLIGPEHVRDTVPISIPEKYLKQYKINVSFLAKQFYVDTKYAKEKGLLFRFDSKELGCLNCSSFRGEWVDGDEVKETCSELSEVHVGHPGFIANQEPCNFYGVTHAYNLEKPEIHPELVKAFNDEKKKHLDVPDSAVQSLLKDLETHKWITK